MSKLVVFNNVSLDGYFVDMNGDMSWAHSDDSEWSAFTKENAQGDAVFVFGRITYELMSTYWPTPYALQSNPAVAERMNAQRKIVFSRTLDEATWNNTTLVKGDIAAEMRRLKDESGPDLLIFGSGTIVSQLTHHALIDEYRLVVNPIVLGSGRTMFEGVDTKLSLKLTDHTGLPQRQCPAVLRADDVNFARYAGSEYLEDEPGTCAADVGTDPGRRWDPLGGRAGAPPREAAR